MNFKRRISEVIQAFFVICIVSIRKVLDAWYFAYDFKQQAPIHVHAKWIIWRLNAALPSMQKQLEDVERLIAQHEALALSTEELQQMRDATISMIELGQSRLVMAEAIFNGSQVWH
jgi:hypothetical protein